MRLMIIHNGNNKKKIIKRKMQIVSKLIITDITENKWVSCYTVGLQQKMLMRMKNKYREAKLGKEK